MIEICVSSVKLNLLTEHKSAEFKIKKTDYGKLQFDNCSRTLFARDSKNEISILLKTLAEESNISNLSNSPINILAKSVNLILDKNLFEIEILGTSILRSLSQLGTACLNHKKGILIFNSPWSGEYLKLGPLINGTKWAKTSLNHTNSEEIKILELVNLVIQSSRNQNKSNEVIISPGQCLLLDFKSNRFKLINYCSGYLCKYSTHFKDKNISLLADSSGQLKLNNVLLHSRNLAVERCGKLFGDVRQNLLSIEDELSKSLDNRTTMQIFEDISSFSFEKVRNHSKIIFNGLDLPMLNMCISASILCDDTLLKMINCNKFSSELFYRRFVSNWIIQLSPLLLK